MNLRLFFILLGILLSHVLYGQKLILSPEITVSDDKNVTSISNLWSSYMNSINGNKADSILAMLWYNGKKDIIKNFVSSNSFYRIGEQFTFNIRKVDDDFYEINTISRFYPISKEIPVILKIFKVYSKEINGEFKLFNYFDVIKPTLGHSSSDFIEYYYPESINLNDSAIQEANEFIKQFISFYNIQPSNKINYIVANSLDECWEILGVPYTMYRSEKKYAGLYTRSNILLATKANHIHELVHGIMTPLYPKTHPLLHEGIATYYGGTANKSFAYHVNNLKQYIINNEIDYLDLDIQLEGVYLEYIVGALVVEYTLKKYGHDKVLQLFSNTNYEDIFNELGVEKEDINNWLHNLIEMKDTRKFE